MMKDQSSRYDAIVFDLLTALLDSWSLWDAVAGSAEAGRRWRKKYLELTYRCGKYRPYETIVSEAAQASDIAPDKASALIARWSELKPWPEAAGVLQSLSGKVKLGIATNCSNALAAIAVRASGGSFDAVATAEEVGFYKPRPEAYQSVLRSLGTPPERTLFVAGSAADIPGASSLGMPVYWHNRVGLPFVDDSARPFMIEDSLSPLTGLVLGT